MSRAVGLLLACLVCSSGLARVPPRQTSVVESLNLYDRGGFDAALDALRGFAARDGEDDFFKSFDRETTRWVEQPVDNPDRRTLVGGTVALEIARTLRDRPDDYAGRFLVWASNLVRKRITGPPSEIERLWHLACLAAMEALEEPWALSAGQESASVLSRRVADLPRGGHLAVALARFPEEPRFLLAQTLSALRGRTGAADDGFEPAALEALKEAAKRYNGREFRADDDIDAQVAYVSTDALALRAKIPEAIRALEALNAYPALHAETELRIGYFEGARQNWSEAFDHLRQVPELTRDADLRFLSYYLAGRILIATARRDDAIGALETALRVVPRARSASTLLAVQLFLTDRADDRARAHTLLRDAYAPPAPVDPWRWFYYGDARLWPVYIAALRTALR